MHACDMHLVIAMVTWGAGGGGGGGGGGGREGRGGGGGGEALYMICDVWDL